MKVPDKVASVNTEEFELALSAIADHLSSEGESQRRDLLKNATRALSGCESLSRREVDRRLRLLLTLPSVVEADILNVAGDIDARSLGLFNTFLTVLTPGGKLQLLQTAEPQLAPPAAGSRKELQARADPDLALDQRPFYRAVALLGTESEHAKNTSLLKEHDFSPLPLRKDSSEDLGYLMTSDICGLVVGGSYWEAKSEEEQSVGLRTICNSSSMLFVKIDETNLGPSAVRLLAEIHSEECRGPEFCRGSGCDLTQADLIMIARRAELLMGGEEVSLFLDALEEPQVRLLRLATLAWVRGRQPRGGRNSRRLGVKFLTGGFSGATVVLLRPDDGGVPLVGKVDELERLRDELNRYEKYIRRWEPLTRPTLHFHLGASLLLYNLVDNPRAPGTPAPTLDDRLEKLLHGELGFCREAPPLERDLSLTISRAFRKIQRLNVMSAGEEDYDKSEWLGVGIRELARKGVCWRVGDTDSRKLCANVEPWLRQVKRLEGAATVHGDMHLRNVLVIEDKEPVFIDYSLSGPGHPCYDLVRLSTAIVCKIFRMLADEQSIADLFRMAIVDGASFASMDKRHPGLLSSTANRIAISSLIASREVSLTVLAGYGGDLSDFIAMQGLVATQALTMPALQSGIARAVILAMDSNGQSGLGAMLPS